MNRITGQNDPLTVFRILGVLLLVFIANQYRLHKLKLVDQFVMMYGGLRGAVAFALVLLIDKKVGWVIMSAKLLYNFEN